MDDYFILGVRREPPLPCRTFFHANKQMHKREIVVGNSAGGVQALRRSGFPVAY
jgi:hypothetical protein